MEQSSWIRKMFEDGIQLKQQYGAGNVFDLSLGNPVMEPPRELKEALVSAAADETPDKLVFAANLGAPVHYAGLILERQQPGSAFRYTQTGGGAQRFEAIVGGHADVSAFSLGEYIAYKAGGLRAIAISAPQRDPRVPEILTAREQGFDFVHANMHFWWFPKGTDQAKIDRIAKFLEDCMQTDIVQNQLDHDLLCSPHSHLAL